MTSPQSVAQSLNPDAVVSLFMLDTTLYGGELLYFVQGSETTGDIVFNGVTYKPVDVEFTGLETSGVGSLPTPHIKVANQGGLFQALVNTWGDLVGCTMQRVRTFARFLDNGSEPDPTAYFGPDVFRIDRKVSETKAILEWEMSAAIDQDGKQLPGRQVIRDTCMWRYRIWDASHGKFDYSKVQCPYTGNQAFDINDNPVDDPAKDQPSRRLNCCKVRFGAGAAWPFGGFPGAARVRP